LVIKNYNYYFETLSKKIPHKIQNIFSNFDSQSWHVLRMEQKSPNNPTCRNKMLILCRLSVALWRNWPKKGKNNYNFKIDFRKSSRYFWGKIWAWLQPQTPKA